MRYNISNYKWNPEYKPHKTMSATNAAVKKPRETRITLVKNTMANHTHSSLGQPPPSPQRPPWQRPSSRKYVILENNLASNDSVIEMLSIFGVFLDTQFTSSDGFTVCRTFYGVVLYCVSHGVVTTIIMLQQQVVLVEIGVVALCIVVLHSWALRLKVQLLIVSIVKSR